jgi:hypothetical protein
MRALAVLCAVFAAHVAYRLFPEAGSDQQWAKYVGDGVGFALLSAAVLLGMRSPAGEVGALAQVGAWWGVLEGAQQAGCGYLMWGDLGRGDLCIRIVGPVPYIVAATVLAALAFARMKNHKSG